MPDLAVRPCLGRCGRLVPNGGYCSICRKTEDRRRGTTAERGYANGWPRVRAAKLAIDPVCQIRTHCQGAAATEVDHIVPIEQAPYLRLEWSNLQSACKPCNVAKSHQIGAKTTDLHEDSSRFAAL
jgi:5-methylcytosine-specific restriction protein A